MSLIKFLHYTTAIGVEVAHLSYWRKYFFGGVVSSNTLADKRDGKETIIKVA